MDVEQSNLSLNVSSCQGLTGQVAQDVLTRTVMRSLVASFDTTTPHVYNTTHNITPPSESITPPTTTTTKYDLSCTTPRHLSPLHQCRCITTGHTSAHARHTTRPQMVQLQHDLSTSLDSSFSGFPLFLSFVSGFKVAASPSLCFHLSPLYGVTTVMDYLIKESATFSSGNHTMR